MHLNELEEHIKEHGTRRYAVKRGFALPLTLGASAAASARHGLGTYRDARATLDQAANEVLAPDVARKKQAANSPYGPGAASLLSGASGGGFVGQSARQGVGSGIGSLAGAPLAGAAAGISGSIGDGIKQLLMGKQFGERKDPLHMMGTAAIGSFGKGLGDLGIQLLQDIAAKAMATVGGAGQDSARKAILQQLKMEDPVLSNADDKVLMEAFHTMSRFAPVLSTDKNAVRSFLRQAVMSGNGADYATIKLLADSERAVTGQDRR